MPSATALAPNPTSQTPRLHDGRRAWYAASVADFITADRQQVVGALSQLSAFDITKSQVEAWSAQVDFLQATLKGLTGYLFLEFSIPRMGKRVDAVVIVGPLVLAIEFKVFATSFDRGAIEQVWDYALDLKNFHEASHAACILPILIATEASSSRQKTLTFDKDNVLHPVMLAPNDVLPTIQRALFVAQGQPLDASSWYRAPYKPTPTIIEAARALYAQHSVEAIARYDAGAENLSLTSKYLEAVIEDARQHCKKVICFVTGVPGAGKTLVGLNIATQRRSPEHPTHAVFLSGNGPLVAVLREALTRDEVSRCKARGERVRKGEVATKVKAFIQNVHHFRDEGLNDVTLSPSDHVVIFDEAQRAWDRSQTINFMRRKKGRPDFQQSEPEFLISYMDRHTDWAVIVCLVGGGQEIHTGEAGISSWLEAVQESFPQWQLRISQRLTDSEYAAGYALEHLVNPSQVKFEQSLHLAVSMRSFRAESLSHFVKTLLDLEAHAAREAFEKIKSKYPIFVTRDLDRAREWIRKQARGSERFGLVASSKALRLKPHAVDVRVDIDPVNWFLNERDDVRSSFYLEDAATEFQVQGLELDWVCVTWDGDLRHSSSGWNYHDFRGSRWQNVRQDEAKNYLRNAYRVLLTRARQGMVIFVPPGNSEDQTRPPSFYDPTYEYLCSIGLPELK